MNVNRILPWYYAATVLFVLLDYGVHINVRVAFLADWPLARLAYYGICFACLALMMWRPNWTTLIGAFESLVTIVALIFGMMTRIMLATDAIVDEHAVILRSEEVFNFLISGSAAYLSWTVGIRELSRHG